MFTLCHSVWCYKLICVSRVKWSHIVLKFPDWIKCPSLLLLCVCVCVCVCVQQGHPYSKDYRAVCF